MALDLGSSQSSTKKIDDHASLVASEQATAIQLKGKGSKNVGSTVKSGNTNLKIGRGATYTVTNTGLDPATLATVLSQANIKTSERTVTSPVTGLPQAQAPATVGDFVSQNATSVFLLAGVALVGVLLIAFFKK